MVKMNALESYALIDRLPLTFMRPPRESQGPSLFSSHSGSSPPGENLMLTLVDTLAYLSKLCPNQYYQLFVDMDDRSKMKKACMERTPVSSRWARYSESPANPKNQMLEEKNKNL